MHRPADSEAASVFGDDVCSANRAILISKDSVRTLPNAPKHWGTIPEIPNDEDEVHTSLGVEVLRRSQASGAGRTL